MRSFWPFSELANSLQNRVADAVNTDQRRPARAVLQLVLWSRVVPDNRDRAWHPRLEHEFNITVSLLPAKSR
jgi:hypothetical protein